MNYQEAMDYLVNLTKFGFNFGLGRVQYLLAQVDNPQDKIKTIHIGGTNGKGSTTAVLASVLQQAGLKVGVFTSPHLHSYRERVVIDGEQIAEERVADLLTRLKDILQEMVAKGQEHPTEFEVNTALAFLYFYEEQVDIAIIEVGLGGAIDSTNVITPLLSVITNVGMDHMDYLGNSLREITSVKAGIIKEGIPVVTAAKEPEVLEVIEKTCREKHSELIKVHDVYEWISLEAGITSQKFDLSSPRGSYQALELGLAGAHQLENAATALAVLDVLVYNYNFSISREAVYAGFKQATWPGRLESVRPGLVLDGAHNLDGAKTLAKALKQLFKYQRLVLCIGMLADKERAKVLAELAPLAEVIIVTKPNSPRAGNWQEMAEEARKFDKEVYLEEDIPRAVELALSLQRDGDLVCVTGSLYMIAEARAYLLGI
ncbi:MAG TPA: folylpolyglutamate synthase/dihydrofolate synthase family protein [Candidatus Deferrimicrobium sp.]|nr:folylpolyglutamate synthase/dihydrofolate synthase family protein [Candidatus Deferrimicrobium sp.]